MQGFQEKGVLELVGAIMRASVVGADYYRTPCGRWWAGVAGLDWKGLYRTAIKNMVRDIETQLEESGFHLIPKTTNATVPSHPKRLRKLEVLVAGYILQKRKERLEATNRKSIEPLEKCPARGHAHWYTQKEA